MSRASAEVARVNARVGFQRVPSSKMSTVRFLVRRNPAYPLAKIPTRGSSQAAGYDLYAAEDTVIPKSGRAVVQTGISVAIPEGHYGRVAPRSGLGRSKTNGSGEARH